MARPGLTKHRKFGRLARRLGSAVLARGVLELLWDSCYESGDPFVGDADDIGYAVGWPDDSQALTAALVECGFLDAVDTGYEVHDLFDHAPDYVSRRAGYEAERRKPKACAHCGREFRSREAKTRFCSDACRSAAYRATRANAGDRDANERDTQRNAPPAPAPAPAPAPKIKIMSADADAATDGFDEFWQAYPKHVAKDDARKAWRKLKPSEGLQSVILAAIADQRTWRAWADVKFVPNAATWLHGKRWDDERPADDRPSRPVVAGPPVAVSQETWAEARQRQLAALRGAS